MRTSAILAFLFLFAICLYTASASTDSVPVSESQSDEMVRDTKDSGVDTANKNNELKPIQVELESAFDREQSQPSEGQLTEAVSDQEDSNNDTYEDTIEDEEYEYADTELNVSVIKDPIQPYNRKIYAFNDKAYYYVFKPMHTGYSKVVPEKARLSISQFFLNIKMPIRLVNCLLQGKFKGAGTEAMRFVINTTVGIGGLFDPAKSQFHLERQDEDFGQTLAKYKIGQGYYIQWPLIGPSTIRDTVGYAGDVALNPLTLISFFIGPIEGFVTKTYDDVNETSLGKGKTYESITTQAIDPYIALQDAYIQNRIKKIKE
ncbi:MAG: VacJ family lipoprotein [Candidatus Jettenia caeni]|nr:MAG: VacJ family lipoprotein [Candidatus Jettenia caeni]